MSRLPARATWAVASGLSDSFVLRTATARRTPRTVSTLKVSALPVRCASSWSTQHARGAVAVPVRDAELRSVSGHYRWKSSTVNGEPGAQNDRERAE